jgi:membrane-associated phospholipid phosphatase
VLQAVCVRPRTDIPRRDERLTGAAGSLAAFVVLAALVAAGSLAGVDQWALDRLMPGLGSGAKQPSVLSSAFPIFDAASERGHVALSAVTYATVWVASFVPSLLVVAGVSWWLWSRGRERLALGLGAAFVAVNAVEAIGKAAIVRPALFATADGVRSHIEPFDASFPSGHMSRAVVLAACVAVCAPRLRRAAVAWVVAVAVLLVVGGWHTPSDVAGGLLLGVAAVLVATRRRSDPAAAGRVPGATAPPP